jgi:predicted Fe-S protein YdhL (DUF1289 family)
MDEKSSGAELASPCVRNCCLDEQDICIGCGRSLEEICGWTNVDNAGKARILALAESRRAARALIR